MEEGHHFVLSHHYTEKGTSIPCIVEFERQILFRDMTANHQYQRNSTPGYVTKPMRIQRNSASAMAPEFRREN